MKELYMKYVEMGIIRDGILPDGILPEKYWHELPDLDVKKDLDTDENNVNLRKK